MKTRLPTLVVLLLCLALGSSTPGTAARALGAAAGRAAVQQGSQHVRLVNYLGGSIGAVTVQGNYAYLGAGPRLFILDVSDPEVPMVAGQSGLLADAVSDVVVAGSYAYVTAGGAGLYIVDISIQWRLRSSVPATRRGMPKQWRWSGYCVRRR